MLFTETYEKTALDEQPNVVDQYRQKLSKENPDAYVPIPVVIPKMSTVVQGAIASYDLFWLVGLPKPFPHPKNPDKMARECINFQCPAEEVCLDLVAVLNKARLEREAQNAVNGENKAEAPAQPVKLDDAVPADQIADILTS